MTESVRNPAEKEAPPIAIKWYYGIVIHDIEGVLGARRRLMEQWFPDRHPKQN